MKFGILNVIIIAVNTVGAVVNVAFNHISNKRKQMLAAEAINSKPLPAITQPSGFFMLTKPQIAIVSNKNRENAKILLSRTYKNLLKKDIFY